jgi:hypothetical protein
MADVNKLNDPEFIKWVRHKFPHGTIEPEDQDIDKSAKPVTDAHMANEYRLAIARRLIRLYAEWKIEQN